MGVAVRLEVFAHVVRKPGLALVTEVAGRNRSATLLASDEIGRHRHHYAVFANPFQDVLPLDACCFTEFLNIPARIIAQPLDGFFEILFLLLEACRAYRPVDAGKN